MGILQVGFWHGYQGITLVTVKVAIRLVLVPPSVRRVGPLVEVGVAQFTPVLSALVDITDPLTVTRAKREALGRVAS